ncbi:hypothetical protein [Frondihabitans australicus]|nr:hypothetical protein [Frondihabitans australicus]
MTFNDGSVRTIATLAIPSADSRAVTTYVTIECNLIHCTLFMTKAQTKQLASTATAGAVVAAACKAASWACRIALAIMRDTATSAVSQGKCVALRKFVGPSLVSWPVIEKCRS